MVIHNSNSELQIAIDFCIFMDFNTFRKDSKDVWKLEF
jgi:hypothetical protein